MVNDGLIKYNSFTVVLLIFLYSITTIFSLFVNQGFLIIILALVTVGPMIILNFTYDLRKQYILAFILEILILLVLVIEYVAYEHYHEAISSTLISFGGIGTLGLLVGCSRIKLTYCIDYLKSFAFIGFFLSVGYLILIQGSFAYSMRFGYGLLPSSMAFLFFFLIESKPKTKFLYLLSFSLSFVLLMAWGSRGTLLAIMLFFFIYLIKNKNWVLLIISFLLVILLWSFLMDIMEGIVSFVSEITGAKKIESILKVVSGEVELMDSSSGRTVLYERSLDLFFQNPFGNGVGYWATDPIMNGLYPHNIFLQVASELGIIGLVALLMLLGLSAVRITLLNSDAFLFWAMLFSITYGRLLVSSTFWERPEFWLLTGAVLFGDLKHLGRVHYA